MHATHAQRRDKVRACMRARGLDAFIVSRDANRFYLSGFELHDAQCNESSGRLLLTAEGDDWLCTDPRFLDAARRLWPEERIYIYRGDGLREMAAFMRGKAAGRVGVEPCLAWDAMRVLGERLNLAPVEGLVESCRIIKDAREIAALRASCALNHQLMHWLGDNLEDGQSEAAISWNIEKFFREHGASELAFPNIVAVGENAALPHCIPGDTPLAGEVPLLVDVGARLDGYCSDQTRTFWWGKRPTPAFTLTQQLVHDAQEAAIAALAPGKTCAEIYQVARKVFEDAGVASAFTHGLGHGVGLETHEAPSLSSRCHTVLAPGMVVTVEPGLYYPEWGGVRREYMLLVTEGGAEIL